MTEMNNHITKEDWDNLEPGDVLVRHSGNTQEVLGLHPRSTNSSVKVEKARRNGHTFLGSAHRKKFKNVIKHHEKDSN